MVLLPSAPPFLAVLPEYPSVGESIAYQINGLIVVFIALSSIWGLMELIGLFFRQRRTTPAAAKSAAHPTPALAPAQGGPSPEIVAVIAASVAVYFDRPHRITAIVDLEDARDWAREGRRDIFASHKTR